jgi:NAD(P)-dependent dehydrogenase (short-subunit alcohol dehydrogenase family)
MGDQLKGKVAIITGAGSIGPGIGNGKASAVIYAREGARVMLVDHNLEAAEETKGLIDKEGGDCVTCKADVTKASNCESMVDQCIQTFGRVDILHNNVGIVEPGGPVEASEESWDRVMNVNLKSVFLTCKYVLPQMEKQKYGSIVNISSIAGIIVPYPAVSYTASKAGIISLTRDIAIQYAKKGIRANTILPGLLNTPMVVASLTESYGGDAAEMMQTRDAKCPTGKQGEAWDVAYAALFLASDKAKYITATTLVVDGGITATI